VKIARTPTCHPELKHEAKGLCHACYVLQWQKEHPERTSATAQRCYVRHKERRKPTRKASAKKYADANQEKILAYRRANAEKTNVAVAKWRAANPERHLANQTAWRKANPEKAKASGAKWRQKNPVNCSARAQKRRARLKEAPGAGVTASQFKAVCEYFGGACAYCLRTDLRLTLDHVEPLARGGAHDVENVVPACLPCNVRKQDKTLLALISRSRI